MTNQGDNHNIYKIQAEWTQGTRNFLYRHAGLLNAGRVLEVGCGTGVILAELTGRTRGAVVGIEKEHKNSVFASQYCSSAAVITSDGMNLPFRSESFDITLCHYYLIWTDDPRTAVSEMIRVTKNGGHLIFACEPDYEGIIEYPESGLKDGLIRHLTHNGLIHANLGRKLISIVSEFATIIESGVISYLADKNSESLSIVMDGICKTTHRNVVFFQPGFYILAKKEKL